MRFLVLLLGLAAAAGTVGAGFLLLLALADRQMQQDDIIDAVFMGAGFFVLGSVLAFVGAVFALFRCKKSAALLFLSAAVGPAVFLATSPLLAHLDKIAPALGASGFLILVALLALLIKPKRAALEE